MSELLILFTTMALLTVTPGPNNFLLATSGVQYGFRRSLPTLLGIVLGLPFLCLCVGLGLGPVFQAVPLIQTGLKFAGAAYLLYLAWRVATTTAAPKAESESEAETESEAEATAATAPIGFVRMAGFQWINPKVWSMAITATTTYMASDRIDIAGAFIVAAVMVVTTGVFNTVWLIAGTLMRHWLSVGHRLLWFNRGMGLLLSGFVVLLLLTS